jgi:hypothetical protein
MPYPSPAGPKTWQTSAVISELVLQKPSEGGFVYEVSLQSIRNDRKSISF